MLNLDNQSLNKIDTNNSINGINSNVILTGLSIRSKDDLINCIPTSITMNATIKADIYSILPCPNGCSASAGLSAILKPIIVTIEEAASDKLLNASAIIAILEATTPTVSLIANKIKLIIIPTTPPSTP